MILNLFSPHKQLRESSCQATACRLSNRQGIPVPWRQLPRACKLYPTSRFPQQPPHMPSLAFWILLESFGNSLCEHHTNRIETSPPPIRSFSHLPPPPDPEYCIPPADRVVWYCLAVGCQLFYDVCLGNSSVGLRKCWGGEKVAVGDYHYSVYKLSDCCTHSPQFKWITFLSASWVPACSSLPDVLLPVSDSTHARSFKDIASLRTVSTGYLFLIYLIMMNCFPWVQLLPSFHWHSRMSTFLTWPCQHLNSIHSKTFIKYH